ncbi:MAG TPA: hypothetical protein VMM55_13700 [Thermohalobaculum sp.]|nr:hypothetical protein [Thermohalobaculum sp.]
MESKYPDDSGIAVGDLLDPTNPLVLWVVLPAAVLAALGMRRGAILWIMACVIYTVVTRVL